MYSHYAFRGGVRNVSSFETSLFLVTIIIIEKPDFHYSFECLYVRR